MQKIVAVQTPDSQKVAAMIVLIMLVFLAVTILLLSEIFWVHFCGKKTLASTNLLDRVRCYMVFILASLLTVLYLTSMGTRLV